MALSFSNPTAFWALLLAIPIIAVYLIRNRPSTRSVSTLLFWDQVADEPGATSFFKSLRHPGSLLAQLALLIFFTIALSDPKLNSAAVQANHQILVIDNSASMQAVNADGISRFELAIAEAIAVIDGISLDGEISIVASCPVPQVVCPPTQSQALARNRLSLLQQTDCVGEISNAISFAGSIAHNSASRSIVVISDDNDDPKPINTDFSTDQTSAITATGDVEPTGAPSISRIKVGQPVNNVGLTLFQVRRATTDPMLWHLLYEVSNFTDSKVSVNLEIRRNETLIDVLPLTLQPEESRRAILTKTSSEGGSIFGKLQATDINTAWTDGFAIDNQATSQLASRPIIDVTLVTSGNWFLQQALNANPLVRLTVVKTYPPPQSNNSSNPIVIFDSVVPASWPPQGRQKSVKALVVAPSQSCRLWTVNGEIDTTFVGDYLETHPLIKYVQLEDIAINSASDVTVNEEATTVVSALEGQPLLSTFQNNTTRIIMLAVNLGRSDLPLRSSFPILLTNALDWLNGSPSEILPQANTKTPTTIAIDTFTVGDQAENRNETASWALTNPNGQTQNVAVVDGVANLGRLTTVGLHVLQANNSSADANNSAAKAADSILLPCNLASKQESCLNQPTATSADEFASSVTEVKRHWNLQSILLALVMLAVITECWFWHRRIIE